VQRGTPNRALSFFSSQLSSSATPTRDPNLTLFRIKVMQWTNWVFPFSHQICCQMLKVRVVSIAFLSSCIAK
jgi:hypothetical protein